MGEVLTIENDATTLRVTQEGGVRRIAMARPPANALSLEFMGQLTKAFEEAAGDEGVRVVVLASDAKVFCAGHDLKEMQAARQEADQGRAFFEKTFLRCSDLMQTIVKLRVPVIAEVNGVATAAGCQLVASCDLAIASEEARFATPGVNIGLFCSTPMVALSRNVHRKHAMEMLLTGEMTEPTHAREIGLINRVVPKEYLGQVVQKYAETIASKSSFTLKLGKEAFYQQTEMPLSDAYDYAARVMVQNMMAKDSEEGIGAFVEKRTPQWKDE
ncbi:enoyl-CoA hydratase [Notoacmeibacter ruber]|uniref:Enoyl-CoA hydratase domain-containing protein 3, mitochondrial n=1 Tax=Notoacmeibacter ruber TaxID=2670375 RepID=A0A3L7JFU7_9HYPH|nr:enoyl-CoA hydratase [Notoacmeibacter ruber]RLQ87332.1 enoyl-CoA hydratase [Notoacmeibacter ruber]